MRKLAILTVALLAALAAGVLAVTAGSGSSHREAPLSALDPTGDDTDVYAFMAPDAPGSLTLIGNWIPFEDPAGGPNFYRFDDRASYYLNVDNTGDGNYDVRYRFKFKTKVAQPELVPVRAAGRQLDQRPEAQRRADVLGRRASATDRRPSREPDTLLARDLPGGAEQRRAQDDPELRRGRQPGDQGLPGGGKVFAGQVDDPFFVDLGSTFDAINIAGRKGIGTGNQGGGKDDLAGYNVHSIVLQVPESDVTRDGKTPADAKAANAVVGVWASTDRPVLQATRESPVASEASSASKRGQRVSDDHGEVQVSRLGNPLVNEVVIPLGQKDIFNATQPSDDLKNFGKYVLSPELAKVINVLFPGLNVPENEPHGHRPGAAHGHSGPDPDRPGRAADRHAEDQPRRGAEPEAQPLRRDRR